MRFEVVLVKSEVLEHHLSERSVVDDDAPITVAGLAGCGLGGGLPVARPDPNALTVTNGCFAVDVGVGVFPGIAKPVNADASGQQFCGHPLLGVHVKLTPPTVPIVQHNGDVNPSVLGVDQRFHQVGLLELVQMDVE